MRLSVVALALLGMTGTGFAQGPVPLTDAQMDRVAPGYGSDGNDALPRETLLQASGLEETTRLRAGTPGRHTLVSATTPAAAPPESIPPTATPAAAVPPAAMPAAANPPAGTPPVVVHSRSGSQQTVTSRSGSQQTVTSRTASHQTITSRASTHTATTSTVNSGGTTRTVVVQSSSGGSHSGTNVPPAAAAAVLQAQRMVQQVQEHSRASASSALAGLPSPGFARQFVGQGLSRMPFQPNVAGR